MSMISRDPFARTELHRESVYIYTSHYPNPNPTTCDFCGNVKETKAGKRFLYRYRVETDGGTVSVDTRLFCSKSCRQTYIGG